MSTVLVVEDDPQIARALSINLRARGYRVEAARNGREALDAAAHAHPDVILLDLGLPDIDGVTVIEGIRGWSTVPIIVVSARHESASKIAGLDAGADDYITKPFAMDELLARLRAAIRRGSTSQQPLPDAVLTTSDGALSIDLAARIVTRDGSPVRLTPIEWRIVEHLAKNRDRLVTQSELLQAVWGPEYGTEKNYLRVYLSQLRHKLEVDSAAPRHFVTEPGMGYRFAL